MDTNIVGGIVGGLFGVLGGVVGTYFSIRSVHGRLEHRVMIRFVVVCWITVILFLSLLFTLPSPFRNFLWLSYIIIFTWGLSFSNRKLAEARKLDEAEKAGVSSQAKLDI